MSALEHPEYAERIADRARSAMDERTRRLAAAPPAAPDAGGASLVTFVLHGERYALETRCVREVLRTSVVTPVPGTPPMLRGVLNLRGELLPAYDLAIVLEVPAADRVVSAWTIVVGAERAEMGLLVDGVSEVMAVDVDALRSPPPSISEAARRYARGIADGVVVVLDGWRLLADPRFFIGRKREADDAPERR